MALTSTQYQTMATAIAEDEVVATYNLDFNKLLEFLKELIPMIMMLPCFAMMKKKKEKIKARLEDSFRDVRRKKDTRVPRQVRKFMANHEYVDEPLQDAIWDRASEQAFLNAETFANAATRA